MAYELISISLINNALALSAAEIHGMATALLCFNEHTDSSLWLSGLVEENETLDINSEVLFVKLFEETKRHLKSEDFEFELFLPDADTTLVERTEALASWCSGFLFGLGLVSSSKTWSENTREIIRDILEFTKLDAEVGGEEDEQAFMEITEYLRSAVLLLQEEFTYQRTKS
jgi:yecA family protein